MDGDLISRKALIERYGEPCHSFLDVIETMPAIDAEPVRHGRWGTYHITGYDGLHPTYTVPCSVCAYEARFTYRYCPNCGARMDGEEK